MLKSTEIIYAHNIIIIHLLMTITAVQPQTYKLTRVHITILSKSIVAQFFFYRAYYLNIMRQILWLYVCVLYVIIHLIQITIDKVIFIFEIIFFSPFSNEKLISMEKIFHECICAHTIHFNRTTEIILFMFK